MSHHADPVEENIETHPVKLAIAVVVGAVGLVVGIILLAYFSVGTHKVGATEASANTPGAIEKRIAPLTTDAVTSDKAQAGSSPVAANVAPPTPAKVALAEPAKTAPAVVASGESIYKSACSACHATGVAGAPKAGDKASWSPRIAKGKPMLYEHALKGFNAMPAKGGQVGLADSDVKSAVDFMLAQVK